MTLEASSAASVCNVCGFASARRTPRICPQCGSNERQRSFRLLFTQILEKDVFDGAMLNHGLLLSPGTVERQHLYPKFQRYVVSALHKQYAGENAFVSADVRDLAPFADHDFDYVQACNVLDYVPEMQRALESIHRVIRPGGFFVFLVPESTLLERDAELAVSVRPSVTGNYWPDKAAVPLVSVGRTTLANMLNDTGFKAREIRIIEPLCAKQCTWWLCRRP